MALVKNDPRVVLDVTTLENSPRVVLVKVQSKNDPWVVLSGTLIP